MCLYIQGSSITHSNIFGNKQKLMENNLYYYLLSIVSKIKNNNQTKLKSALTTQNKKTKQ